MDKILNISILIPTMNRPKSLKMTLDSIATNGVVPSQVVIIDQSSTDEAVEQVKKICSRNDFPLIEYYYQNTPSLTKARNLAFQHAQEEIVVCCDDDVEFCDDTLTNIYQLMQNDTYAMIAGIDRCWGESKTNLGYFCGTKSFKKRKVGHVTRSMLGRYPDSISGEISTEWAMGYFFVIRKSLTNEWKLKWDEALVSYAYAEDLDFSFNYYKFAKAHSLKCVLNDSVCVYHRASQEYRIPSRKNTFMYVLHRRYLCSKHKMGILSEIAIGWADFWVFISRVITSRGAHDMKEALYYYIKHKADIKKGHFYYG